MRGLKPGHRSYVAQMPEMLYRQVKAAAAMEKISVSRYIAECCCRRMGLDLSKLEEEAIQSEPQR